MDNSDANGYSFHQIQLSQATETKYKERVIVILYFF